MFTGLADSGEDWRSNYQSALPETEDFEQIVDSLWLRVKPLYEQLHAYIRKKLRKLYKDQEFPKGGQIPAHIVGKGSLHVHLQLASEILDNIDVFPLNPILNNRDAWISCKL